MVYWGNAMYIWILLATIMVALSFFNVSPRADKEHALNDIKAATVVNRFKAEHAAMLKNFNCEILFRTNNQAKQDGVPWDSVATSPGQRKSATGAVDVSSYNPAAVQSGQAKELMLSTGTHAGEVYTKLSNHLPIGYETAKYNLNHIHHLVFCLRKNAVEATSSSDFIACDSNEVHNAGHQRYLVSFAQINDRWTTHDEYPTPLPVLVNLLSKTKTNPAVFGWTDCSRADNTGKGCVLRGREAFTARTYYSDETDEKGNKIQKAENVVLPKDAIFWQNKEFLETCVKKGKPCLFAYEPFPIADTACRCWNAMHPDPTEQRYGEKCHPRDLRW